VRDCAPLARPHHFEVRLGKQTSSMTSPLAERLPGCESVRHAFGSSSPSIFSNGPATGLAEPAIRYPSRDDGQLTTRHSAIRFPAHTCFFALDDGRELRYTSSPLRRICWSRIADRGISKPPGCGALEITLEEFRARFARGELESRHYCSTESFARVGNIMRRSLFRANSSRTHRFQPYANANCDAPSVGP